MSKDRRRSPDTGLFCIVFLLLVIGIILVFDASYGRAGQVKYTGGDSLYFLKRQAMYGVFGLVLMFAVMHTRYWKLKPVGSVILAISILGLILVLAAGPEVNGAKRWMRFGPISFQPSEFAKLGLVMYLAAYLTAKGRAIRDVKVLATALGPLALIAALVMAQPDMGTTIVLCSTAMVMVFLGGAKSRHLALIMAIGVILACVFAFSADYRRERVLSFIDPFKDYHGSGYQVCHSLIALGSGGPFGVGLCEGREKLFYLPAEHTDFIYAVLGEETGLIGTLFLAGLFLILGIRGLHIARRTKDSYGRLLSGGATTLICGQALLNMLVVTSTVPATGVPLPFISYGGCSLAMNLLCAGVILSVSKYPDSIETYENENSAYGRRHRRTRVSRNRHSRSSALGGRERVGVRASLSR